MIDYTKPSEGYCKLTLYKDDEYPLVIYRCENGKPILEENKILLIRISNSNSKNKVGICLNGDNYIFLRGEFLFEYNKEKSHLTKQEWDKLKEIVDKKLENLESKVNL